MPLPAGGLKSTDKRKTSIYLKSKGNIKNIRPDLQDRQDIPQYYYPVNPVKIPYFLKWIQKQGEKRHTFPYTNKTTSFE